MLELLEKNKPVRIPAVKQGNIISFVYEGATHNGLFYKETSEGCLQLVSLNHECGVWSNIDVWWHTEKNLFEDIEVLGAGTVLVVT